MNGLVNLVENQVLLVDFPTHIRLADLDQYLDEIWQSRMLFDTESEQEGRSIKQPFLTFGQDVKTGKPTIKAGKYVGFIQYEGITIQIIPKLFEPSQTEPAFRHLLWWLSYCQQVQFPFTDLWSDVELVNDFPEALISHFARFAHQLVSSLPYHQYEETTETFPFLRGRLNTQQYVNTSLSRGNWHQLVCDYEPFVFNNRLNQIIKYVAQKLTYLCRFPETHRHLEKLIFILDEVHNIPASVQDCDSLHLNRFYNEYESCLDMCRFFLADSYLTRADTHQNHACFLAPMDYVYEDFITGVIKQHFHTSFQKITSQATKWLTQEEVFQTRNDLLLTYPDTRNLVVDTKYKIRSYQLNDRKAGITQSDLYQMISYALRQNTREVLLLYPLAYGQSSSARQTFTVSSELLADPERPVRIRAVDLTITGDTKQDMVLGLVRQLEDVFTNLEGSHTLL